MNLVLPVEMPGLASHTQIALVWDSPHSHRSCCTAPEPAHNVCDEFDLLLPAFHSAPSHPAQCESVTGISESWSMSGENQSKPAALPKEVGMFLTVCEIGTTLVACKAGLDYNTRTNITLWGFYLLVWEEGENNGVNCCSPPVWNPCGSH